jgi:excisionase family DNA binding protein
MGTPDLAPQDDRLSSTTLRAEGLRVLTLEEAAVHLRVSVEVVRKLIAAEALPALKLSARNTRIAEAALYRFIHQNGR